MRLADKIEIHQHVLEKLIIQRNKSWVKLSKATTHSQSLEYLQALSNICLEEIATRNTLNDLYEER